MGKIDLEATLKEEGPSAEVKAESFAVTPEGAPKVQVETLASSKVIMPVPLSPMELAKIVDFGKEKFALYESMVDDMLRELERLHVTDDAAQKRAVEVGARAKRLGKEIDTRKDDFLRPANELVKGIRNFVKPFTDKLDRIEVTAKQKVKDYLTIKEVERRKAELALKQAQEEVQKKIDAEAAAAGVESVKIPTAVVKEEPVVTRTEFGSAHLRKSKDFKIVNPALVPREYLIVDERAIRDAIKRGVEEIPGVLIFEDTDVILRT